MLEFGQDISFVATSDCRNDYRLTSSGETHVSTCPGYMANVPGARFSSVTKSNIEMEHLEFGQDFTLVALMIIENISHSH